MILQNDTSWLFSIFAIVTLFAGSSFLFIDESAESEQIQFSELTDADIDGILAVKAEMFAVNN